MDQVTILLFPVQSIQSDSVTLILHGLKNSEASKEVREGTRLHVAFCVTRTLAFLTVVEMTLLLTSMEKDTRILHSHLAVQSLLHPFSASLHSMQQTISAEARWALFVAKHNLAFLTSEHASKMFSKMFPDSKIASNFGCGRTKATAIVKEALAPHYLEKTVQSMSNPFSLLIDESNDKTDKSCIILVRTLYEELGDVAHVF